MLGFIRRSVEARRARKAQRKLDEARRRGGDFGRELADQIRAHLVQRLEHIRGAYLEILRQRLSTIYDAELLQEPEVFGPSDAARGELQSFLRELKALPDRLVAEMRVTLHDWMGAADVVGIGAEIERLIRERVDEATLEMMGEGMQLTGVAIEEAMAKGYPRAGTASTNLPDNAASPPWA